MSEPRTVLIAGAGIAGLSLALALAARGVASRIIERRNELTEAGAGIQLGPNAMHILRRIGVAERLEPMAGRPSAIIVHDGASGAVLSRLPLGEEIARRHGAPYRVAHRADLQAALLAAARERAEIQLDLGFEVSSWRETAVGVAAQSASGAEALGHLMIGADGLWSSVRRVMHPGHPLPYSGKMAMRTVLDGASVSPRFAGLVTGVWLSRDAHVVHYPVRGDREIAVVAIVDEPIPREGWGTAIEAGFVLGRLRGFSAELLRFLEDGRDWRAWSLYDPPPLPSWSRGRVGLSGDAAHPILPFLAQGGVMAIEDAEVLAAAIAADLDTPARALVRYEAARRDRVQRVQDASRRNGKIYHMAGAMGFARDAVLRLAPGSLVMSGYDWLYGWKSGVP